MTKQEAAEHIADYLDYLQIIHAEQLMWEALEMAVKALLGVERVPYVCDPEKNIECDKRGCVLNGGQCSRTFNKAYAREWSKRNE